MTRPVDIEGDELVDDLAGGIGSMVTDLSAIITEIVESASQFNEGSRVIASAAQTLAAGAQNQATTVDQMGVAIEDLTSSISQVNENAAKADTAAAKTNALAEQGGRAVDESISKYGSESQHPGLPQRLDTDAATAETIGRHRPIQGVPQGYVININFDIPSTSWAGHFGFPCEGG